MNGSAEMHSDGVGGPLAAALDLAAVAVRRLDGTILHWSKGMADLYGWSAREARNRVSHDLLRTRFPQPLSDIEAELQRAGEWTGELIHTARDGRRIIVVSRWRLHRDAPDAEPLIVEANTEITTLRATEAALAASEALTQRTLARLNTVFEAVPVGLILLDPNLRCTSVNALLAKISGKPVEAHIGRDLRNVLPAPLAEAIRTLHRRVLQTGMAVHGVHVSGETTAAPGRTRHWIVNCQPKRRGPAASVAGVCCAVLDVTDHVEAERAQHLVAREASHRVKNALTTVMAAAEQTLRQAGDDPSRFVHDFTGRLKVLASAHDLLTQEAWQGADLAVILRAALAPWRPGKIDLVSPDPRMVSPRLNPQQAQALALALHELATNAVKHGALSSPAGRVAVRWSIAADRVVSLDWTETGGPPPAQPSPDRRGFGSRLLERALPQQLGPGSEVKLAFEPSGLHASIRLAPVEPKQQLSRSLELREFGHEPPEPPRPSCYH
jgi:PAS domain S-box-containing protein